MKTKILLLLILSLTSITLHAGPSIFGKVSQGQEGDIFVMYRANIPTATVKGTSKAIPSSNYYLANANNFGEGLFPSVSEDIVIAISRSENTASANHKGYYAVTSVTFNLEASPQIVPSVTIREIPSPVAVTSSSGVIVTWAKPLEDSQITSSNIFGFKLFRSTNNAVTDFTLVTSSVITTLNYFDETVVSANTYYYTLGLVFRGGVEIDAFSANSNSISYIPSLVINSAQSSPSAVISSPLSNSVVTGTISIIGTANATSLNYFAVYFAPVSNTLNLTTLNIGYTSVSGSVLATWNTKTVSNDVYQIALLVLDKVQGVTQSYVIVTVNNLPPPPVNSVVSVPTAGITANILVPTGSVEKEVEIKVTLSASVVTANSSGLTIGFAVTDNSGAAIAASKVTFVKALEIQLWPTGNDAGFNGKVTINTYLEINVDLDPPLTDTVNTRIFYHDVSSNMWKDDGISIVAITPTQLTFRVTHLTYFAIAQVSVNNTPTTPVSIFDSFTAVAGDSKVDLSWIVTANISSYGYTSMELWRISTNNYALSNYPTSPTAPAVFVTSINSVLSGNYTDSGLTNYQYHYYSLWGKKADGSYSITANAYAKSIPNSKYQAYSYPNPFAPLKGETTTLVLPLTTAGEYRLYIFNMLGDIILDQSGVGEVGANKLVWDGKDAWGKVVPNGVYLMRVMQSGKVVASGKLAVLD